MDGGDAGVVQVEDADALATSDRGPVGERQRAPAPADLQAEGRPDPGRWSVEAVHQTVGPVVEHDGPPVRAARARLRAPDTRTWQPSTPHAEDVGAARLAGTARRNSIAAGTTLHIGVTGEDCAQNTGRANGHGKPGQREALRDPNESAAGPRGVRDEHPGGSRGRQLPLLNQHTPAPGERKSRSGTTSPLQRTA